MAKTAPYPPCTGRNFRLKFLDTARILRQVTQPTLIAVPLAVRLACTNIMIANAQARVLQPFPATISSLQNTCFFAKTSPIL
jgi:hypothetical protein